MLRDLQANVGKVKNTMFKSAAKMVTGAAVVKDHTDMTFGFPEAATAENLFFVTKERIPTGINAGRGDMSDYDDDFVNIAEGEFCGLEQYTKGERFATDQYTKGDLAVGDVVMADTTGKLVKATATTVKSIYMYVGEYDDVGHTLAMIEVLDTPVANSGD